MKKAQGIGINIVVIAAIALLVLIIVALLIGGGSRNFVRGTNSCEAQGGKCSMIKPDTGNWNVNYNIECQNTGELCWEYQYG